MRAKHIHLFQLPYLLLLCTHQPCIFQLPHVHLLRNGHFEFALLLSPRTIANISGLVHFGYHNFHNLFRVQLPNDQVSNGLPENVSYRPTQ
ncbi:unnamed protein product [Meloidogyne enterolobii]|uniref:Uncharacterized protein n=2 Tax=Meloidogyne enterolobii TaxID=390850 RepID=A0ACB0Y5W8_MELEN